MLKFVPQNLHFWAKFKIVDGDLIHASKLARSARDATFVRYTLDIDLHRRNHRRRPEFRTKVYYGQVLRFFELDLPENMPGVDPHAPRTLILAEIAPCQFSKKNEAGMRYYVANVKPGSPEIVDAGQIDCLVARVKRGNRYAVVERYAAAERIDFASEARDLTPDRT
ncbi:hypothetical protein FB107DRAFT_215741 [Schizophyllum commune]